MTLNRGMNVVAMWHRARLFTVRVSENGKIQGKKMSAVWQISRRFGQAEGAWTRFATGYCITATVSVKSDPLSPKSRLELPRYLSAADIYLLPSYAEGCAQSGMEAMAAGLCVIATRELGLPIMDGENGFVVPCGDAVALVDRIVELESNRSRCTACGVSAARTIASNYTWRNYAENLISLWQDEG